MFSNLRDDELIEKCLDGNDDAFAELVTRYKNLVYSVIYRIVNHPQEAEDLSQEVFLKVYRKLRQYSTEYKFSTWIVRIAVNQVIDHRRKKKQDTVSVEELIVEPSMEETPEATYMNKEKRLELNQMIESLPEIYKMPIVLFHQEGLSYQEIADALHLPLTKVKNRIFRGRKMLKDAVQKGGVIL